MDFAANDVLAKNGAIKPSNQGTRHTKQSDMYTITLYLTLKWALFDFVTTTSSISVFLSTIEL